jgi:hypothetical protein
MNITTKQYIGGFVGGFLGIICFHFFGFWQMLAGCILGFTAGFWHQEIIQYIRTPKFWFGHFAIFWKNDWEKTCEHFLKCWTVVSFFGKAAKKDIFKFMITIGKILMAIKKAGLWIICSPLLVGKLIHRIGTKINYHPVYQSLFTSTIITIICSLTVVFTTIWLCDNFPLADFVATQSYSPVKNVFSETGANYKYVLPAVFMIAGFMVNLAFSFQVLGNKGLFYKRQIEYSLRPNRFIVKEFIKNLYVGCLVIYIAGIIFGLMVMGVVWLMISTIIGIFIVSPIIKLAWLFAKLSTQKATLTGGIVTLFVTGLTAMLFKDSMTNSTVFLTAFLNGNLCGASVILSHKVVRSIFCKKKFARIGNFGWDEGQVDIIGFMLAPPFLVSRVKKLSKTTDKILEHITSPLVG